jgi:hypothetical protein
MLKTDSTKVMTKRLWKIEFNKVTSGKLAPAELMTKAMIGPSAIPFTSIIWLIGIIVESLIYNGMPMIAAAGINHH